MSSLKILLKNNFNVLMGSLLKKRKNRTSGLSTMFLGFGAFVLMLALFSLQAYLQFFGYVAMSLPELGLFNGVMLAFVVLVLYVSMKVTATQRTSDMDTLLALPIKKSVIALSKVLTRYVFDLMLTTIILLPYVVFYQIFTSFSVFVTLAGVATIVLLPLMSVGLNYILEFVVVRLFNKIRLATLFKSAFALVVFFATMGLFVFVMPNLTALDPTSVEKFLYSSPPISWFVKLILVQDIVSVMQVLAVCVLPFTFGTWLYVKNMTKTFAGYQNKKTNLQFSHNKKPVFALIKKEIKRYFFTPIYVLNTIIGPIFMVAFTVFLAVKGRVAITEFIGVMPPTELVFVGIVLILCSFITLTVISASSVSLEGKNLWILKSSPVKHSDVFVAKAMPNILLTVPIVAVCSVVLSIALSFTLFEAIIAVLATVIVSLIISFGGVLINLFVPKMDWTEEVQVVKQGLSVILTMLLGALLIALPIALFVSLQISDIVLISLSTIAFYLAVLAVILALLFSVGKKLFNKI